MLCDTLMAELQFEAENTRKLFSAISDNALQYQPNDFNWTIAQLASHTSELYSWWPPTLHLDVMEMNNYQYDQGDISSISGIRAKLEENLKKAMDSFENYPEDKLHDPWTMTQGGVALMPPMPRIQVIRTFLMNHLYHHRGELVAYLRAAGQKVPGLYGASYEEQQALRMDIRKSH